MPFIDLHCDTIARLLACQRAGHPPTCGGGNPSTSTWKSSAAAATCSRPSPSS